MLSLRLYDPDRTPTNWTEIIRPGQFVAFAKTLDTGAPCDAEGQPFPTIEDATCLLFEGLDEAEACCREQVDRAPTVRFEIFDSTGRVNGPLYVIVHPTKTAQLEGNPRGMRLRAQAAILLLAIAALSFWYNLHAGRGVQIFPTLLGINLVVVAARLLQLNASYAHAERLRKKRILEHEQRAR
jgi:hypothetical protein